MKNINAMKEHIQVRDKLRKQFDNLRSGDADLLYESRKLFQPLSDAIATSEKVKIMPPPPPPAIAAPPVLPALAPPPPPPAKRDYATINPDAELNFELLNEMGFTIPSKIIDTDKYEEIIEEVNRYNRYVLGKAKRGSVSSDEKDIINEKINANKDYVKRLRLLISGQNLVVQQGKGLKLIGNKFGNLSINRDELALGRLRAVKDGNTVIDETVNSVDLYNLLTKRFCKTHNYSKKSIDIFRKLVKMADIPLLNSRCPKRKLLSVKYYNDPNDLVNRLQILVASKKAGNTGLDNEISNIVDELLTKSYISKDMAIKLYNNLF